ncbi:GDSL esterase/lipase 1-like [Juglans regia]|uniref:GDSL esterase/lipase 1-like n=2 Tax=Juglans regia TaxID=51240 RepID=A0A6P9EKF1_JUGRE|nr:GDSL esterase/lipase 1-like [Juglans regia]
MNMMMSSRIRICFLVFMCASLSIIPTPSLGHSHICLPNDHVAQFIFGDSLFDAGNNNYINTTYQFRANVYPYGETFFNYPTGRFSDGRTIPDFIAEFAKLPLIPAYLHPGYKRYADGANFASAGAGALVGTHLGSVIDLHTQLSNFKRMKTLLKKEIGEAEAKTLVSRAVYMTSIGGNDYAAPYTANSSLFQSYSPEEYVDMVIGNLTTVIKGIHKEGGRKFAFVNLAPLGCFPLLKAINAGECVDKITALVKLHNKALPHVLQELESQLKGFKYSITDFYSIVSEIMNNPIKYGFKEGETACCGSGPYRGIRTCGVTGVNGSVQGYELCENPSDYVTFDSSHPTERANLLYAKAMWNGNQGVTGPYNVKALVEQK